MQPPEDTSGQFPPLDARAWLHSIGMGQYADLFEEQAIDLDMLMSVTESDLQTIGVAAFGHRRTILREIGKLRDQAGPAESVVDEPPVAQPFLPVPFDEVVAQPREAAVPEAAPSASQPRRRHRFGGWFLIVSIAAHILFGIIATWLVVQTIQTKRKLTFTAQPGSPSINRVIARKVSLQKKQSSSGAPVQARRITTTGVARVALPAMPAMPVPSDEFTGGQISGFGGTGTGLGMGIGSGFGSGGGGGGDGRGGGLTMFGVRSGRGLTGRLYDFKQDKNRRSTGISKNQDNFEGEIGPGYREIVKKLAGNRLKRSVLKDYYQASTAMSFTYLMIPTQSARVAPEAFKCEEEVAPKAWMVHYSGVVMPPKPGKYRFWGYFDDVLFVYVDGKPVFDASGMTGLGAAGGRDSITNRGVGQVLWTTVVASCGKWFRMEGKTRIDIMIGEVPGRSFGGTLMIEEEGEKYEMAGNYPILPLFATVPIAPADEKRIFNGNWKFARKTPVFQAIEGTLPAEDIAND